MARLKLSAPRREEHRRNSLWRLRRWETLTTRDSVQSSLVFASTAFVWSATLSLSSSAPLFVSRLLLFRSCCLKFLFFSVTTKFRPFSRGKQISERRWEETRAQCTVEEAKESYYYSFVVVVVVIIVVVVVVITTIRRSRRERGEYGKTWCLYVFCLLRFVACASIKRNWGKFALFVFLVLSPPP